MKKLTIILAALALAACGPSPTAGIPQLDQVTGQPTPQAQQQGGGFDVGSAAIGALGGAVVGNMMGKSSSPAQTVVVDRRPVYVAPSRPYYGSGKTTTTTTTVKKSMFGGTKTITRSVTRRR